MEGGSALRKLGFALMALGALGPAGSARTREVAFTTAVNSLLKQAELEAQRRKEEQMFKLKERELDIEQQRVDILGETLKQEMKRLEMQMGAFSSLFDAIYGDKLGAPEAQVEPQEGSMTKIWEEPSWLKNVP